MNIFQLLQHIKNHTRTTHSLQTLIDVIITQITNTKILETGVIKLVSVITILWTYAEK